MMMMQFTTQNTLCCLAVVEPLKFPLCYFGLTWQLEPLRIRRCDEFSRCDHLSPLCRTNFLRLRSAVTVIQKVWRGYRCMRNYRTVSLFQLFLLCSLLQVTVVVFFLGGEWIHIHSHTCPHLSQPLHLCFRCSLASCAFRPSTGRGNITLATRRRAFALRSSKLVAAASWSGRHFGAAYEPCWPFRPTPGAW